MNQQARDRLEIIREKMHRSMQVGARAPVGVALSDLAFLVRCVDKLVALENELAEEDAIKEST